MGIIAGILEAVIDLIFARDIADALQRLRRAKPVTAGMTSAGSFETDSGPLIRGQVVETRLKGYGKSTALVVDPDAVYLVRLTGQPEVGAFELASLEKAKVGRQFVIPGEVFQANMRWCRTIRGQKRLSKADFARVEGLLPKN